MHRAQCLALSKSWLRTSCPDLSKVSRYTDPYWLFLEKQSQVVKLVWWVTGWEWTVLWRPTRPSSTNTQKRCRFHHRGLGKKVGSQEIPGVTGNFGLGGQKEAGQRLTEFCQGNTLVIANTLFQQHRRRLYTWPSADGQYRNQIDYILCSQRWRSSIQSAKTRLGADCGWLWTPYCQIQT